MRRLLTAVVVMPAALGCGPIGMAIGLVDKAEREFAVGKYEACEAHAAEAIRLNASVLQKLESVEDINAANNMRALANPFHARAYCLHRLGRVSEAIPDMEKSVLYMAKACQLSGAWDAVEKGRTCRQSADDTEALAKWKKELAAKEKP